MTLAEAAALLEEEGLAVSAQSDGLGNFLQSSVNGGDFTLEAYNCNASGRCTEFLFAAVFDLPDGFPEEKINDWNSTRLGGRAYLDEERDPYLDHVVSVSGPVDAGAFREGFYLWAQVLSEFMAYIDLPRMAYYVDKATYRKAVGEWIARLGGQRP